MFFEIMHAGILFHAPYLHNQMRVIDQFHRASIEGDFSKQHIWNTILKEVKL